MLLWHPGDCLALFKHYPEVWFEHKNSGRGRVLGCSSKPYLSAFLTFGVSLNRAHLATTVSEYSHFRRMALPHAIDLCCLFKMKFTNSYLTEQWSQSSPQSGCQTFRIKWRNARIPTKSLPSFTASPACKTGAEYFHLLHHGRSKTSPSCRTWISGSRGTSYHGNLPGIGQFRSTSQAPAWAIKSLSLAMASGLLLF